MLMILSAALLLAACAKKPDMIVTATKSPAPPQNTAVQASALPAGHPDISLVSNQPAPAPAAAPAGLLTGKVIETMNAGGYTYLNIQTAQGPVWAAVREFKTKVGDKVSVNAEMTMENFESNTLHRKFDRIVFGSLGGPAPAQQASMLSGSNPMGSPSQHMAPKVDIGDVKVAKAEGPNAKTVAELWSGKAALKGKTVVVRGKVVKSLSGIMGKNWIHLRDGSGARADGTDDITVTTDGTAAVGDVVVVTGVLNTDKDFGAGYLYPVIIEDAKVVK